MGKVIALAVLCLILAVLCFIAANAEIWKTYDIDMDEWRTKKMMRENIGIFRGKCIDTKQWKEGYFLGLQDKMNGKDLFFIVDEMGEYHRVEPETVGEFTGITDEDGAGIFEGDIVENVESGMRALVQYFPEHAAFMLWCRSETINQIEYVGEISFFEVQVIGNIHDNPELIGNI